jgi:hypothetical protein
MTGTPAKIAYCICLFVLAACAVIPRPAGPTIEAVPAVTAYSTESRLADAIHARIAIEAAGELHDYRLDELSGQIEGLRRIAFEDDARGARIELIDALADELSAAMARRSAISDHLGANHPELDVAEQVIRGLTSAINDEVHASDV